MASEFAAPPQIPPKDEMDSSFQQPSNSFTEPTVNGFHAPSTSSMQPSDLATGGKLDAPPQQLDETHLPLDQASPQAADPNPTELPPVAHVEAGIAPLADFIPKDSQHVSHPTPPPDELLITGEADVDVDVEMAEAEIDSPLPATSSAVEPQLPITSSSEAQSPPSLPVQAETSLIRPREDDGEDERAAKRSKVDDAPADILVSETAVVETPIVETPVVEAVAAVETPPGVEAAIAAVVEPVVEDVSEVMADAIVEPVVEHIAEIISEPMVEPVVETVTEPMVETEVEPVVEEVIATVVEPVADPVVEETVTPAVERSAEPVVEPAPEAIVETITQEPDGDVKVETTRLELDTGNATIATAEEIQPVAAVTDAMMTETPIDEKPVETPVTPMAPPPAEIAAAPTEVHKYPTEPMTKQQKAALLEKTKNLKKTKNSLAFLKPVDYIALNIPNYPDIIKNPMDLSTMENKLKDGQYASVQDFANDFDLIIQNARAFNGDQHAVTQAGFAMEAYFRRVMQSVPKSDEQEAPKPEKKRSPSIPREKRRESRAVTQPTPAATATPTAAASAPTDVYALQADGTPQIRRQSSMSSRPARAIKPPQNREIPYAKPKRKEHQLELRFCEYVLDELKSPKYAQTNQVFMFPVDPVALNIPHYRQVVKTPMDLSTMQNKLRGGQYGTAAEFKKDFDLMIKNCLIFNPAGNPVRDLGIQFQRQFEELWQAKDKWERKNQPASNRASSASADEESGADDEDEDEDPEEDAAAAKIRALQKQLADMQNALSGLHGEKQAKSKKSKSGQSSSKKQASSKAAAPSKKAAPKPVQKKTNKKFVTYDEKQEISEAVEKMTEAQVGKLTEIITQNCSKYRDMDEMELEIDELPDHVQVLLLDYVRKIFGNPKKKAREPSPDDAAALDDDDYEEKGGSRGGKRKKHRPMGKKEQQDTITNIKNKLAEFSQMATSGSESPTNSSFVAPNAQADTSGDEESEESEEE